MNQSFPDQQAVADALRGVIEPASGRDVTALGLVKSVSMEDGLLKVTYQLPPNLATEPLKKHLTEQTRAKLLALQGTTEVGVEFTIFAEPTATPMPGIKNVIAVGAGKGGVGKSTVATLLAIGLSRKNLKCGLLDADVYGPSLPKLTGTENAEPLADMQGRLIPPEKDGLKIMSMGYLVPADQAVIWRGPMAQKYVKEFIDRGLWGELDYLIVDLPPGTGDIPLTLAQSVPLTGAIVVCTPQDVALLDAVKALRMYEKLGVAPIGMIENMSYYVCPECGHRDEMFGHGGCAQAARELNVPFLGGIPLHVDIRRLGDEGKPTEYFSRPPAYVVEALETIVDRLIEQIERGAGQRTPPPQLNISG